MKLIAHGFSGNTTLRGTVTAVDDQGDALGWEANGNWSSPTFQEKAIKGLVANIGISLEKARAAIAQALKEARRQAGIPTPEDTGPQPRHDLPIIVVSGRQPRDIEAAAWRVLQAAEGGEPEFFRLGSAMTHLEREDGRVYLHALTLAGLRRHLEARADFIRLSKKGDEEPAIPPRTMLEDMLAVAQPPLPLIMGVVHTPVLLANGSLLLAEGYHPAASLYLSLRGTSLPQLPERPGGAGIAQARALLLDEFLSDFPFASEADRAHAIATLLTPVIRPAIKGPTPLFVVDAPVQGTGKGLLAQAVGLVATGEELAIMTETRDEDEWRKRITAKLKSAPSLVLIDNVRRPLESAALSAALTEPMWEDRELGVSRMVRLPIRCTWLATGNNVSLSAEISRRVARIRIDAQIERPWERSGFHHDPLETWVREHRGELLWALLVLVRAWLAAGRPAGRPRMGRFQVWADTLGGILEVAGIPGFLDSRQEVYALATAQDEGWRAFVEAWWTTYKEQRVGVDKLFDLAKEHRLLIELRGGRTDQGARVALGRDLSSMRDRVVGEWKVRFAGKAQGGGLAYFLQSRIEAQKSYTSSASSPAPTSPPALGLGEDSEDGEDFSASV